MKVFISLSLVAGMLLSCGKNKEKTALKVDLAALHDQGMFKPQQGDRVHIVGNFNDWQAGDYELTDPEGDWIYEYKAVDVFEQATDTLVFKFVISTDHNRELTNSGWETIPNRSTTLQQIQQEQPVFVYNEPWSAVEVKELTFRVNMSNQKVLEFFDPERGDQVVVSGSFTNWNSKGIELERQHQSLSYQLRLPVEIQEDVPTLYKYRIISGKERKDPPTLPNGGWETIENRVYQEASPAAYFNNQRRILRVEISETWLRQKIKLTPDDYLHLKLNWNGTQSRNYRLAPTGTGSYETAVQIPESVADLKAKVMVNYERTVYEIDELQIALTGRAMKIE